MSELFVAKKLKIFRKICETVEKKVSQIRQLMTTIAAGTWKNSTSV